MATINWQNAPTAEEKLEKTKQGKLAEINRAAEAAVQSIRQQYPQFEIDTWTEQKAEAEAYQTDNSSPTPLLSGIAEGRGISLDELVQKVMAKVKLYRSAVAPVTGKRQRLEDEILAADTVEAVNAVEWPA
ncbi:hypothetical protein C7446_2586 [Kushneria sinocarnis]|uniref:DUF4376 domain-containing protein n=1 Tax=Kushneria sinocarnis TaxID=595502 RepID=A0A420WUP2_9GAMM|nr:hypothetical protein [Kushneria sinocarnis]RKQ97166.1 hypothetical protein C7446_2586 [Kushneria sinocarnis]